MDLFDIVHRTPAPDPWVEGEKIPWNDPDFSARMLAEHLSQHHDLASRRSHIIDAHVRWIHEDALNNQASRILDLGCGPGLYTSALAKLGHDCVGIDFSPASVAYAMQSAEASRLHCEYRLGDIRTMGYGEDFDLAMLIFGEFNVFRIADAQHILRKAREALTPTGSLLLEVHTVDAVRAIGSAPPAWRTAERGLFQERAHIVLTECFWNEDDLIATERYYVIDVASGRVNRYAQSMQAYTESQYRELLWNAGFDVRDVTPNLGYDAVTPEFVAFVAVAR